MALQDVPFCLLRWRLGLGLSALATANTSWNKQAEVWTYNLKDIVFVWFVSFLVYLLIIKFNTFYFLLYDMLNVKTCNKKNSLSWLPLEGGGGIFKVCLLCWRVVTSSWKSLVTNVPTLSVRILALITAFTKTLPTRMTSNEMSAIHWTRAFFARIL